MALIATLSGSPNEHSRTEVVLEHLADYAYLRGHDAQPITVRDLPAHSLVRADATNPEIARAVGAIEGADAVIVGTPIYRAAYAGILKAFLDLLPRNALRGKAILPIATGGSLAHALVVDYALTPVLRSLQPAQVAAGRFVLADQVNVDAGRAERPAREAVSPALQSDLDHLIDDFLTALEHRQVTELVT